MAPRHGWQRVSKCGRIPTNIINLNPGGEAAMLP